VYTGIARGRSVVRNLILIIFRITSFPFHAIKSPPRVAYFLSHCRRTKLRMPLELPLVREIWCGWGLHWHFFHFVYILFKHFSGRSHIRGIVMIHSFVCTYYTGHKVWISMKSALFLGCSRTMHSMNIIYLVYLHFKGETFILHF